MTMCNLYTYIYIYNTNVDITTKYMCRCLKKIYLFVKEKKDIYCSNLNFWVFLVVKQDEF